MGQYAPIIIEPAGADANAAPRDHVVMLSDHSIVRPAQILRNLKVDPGHYNRQQQTLAGLVAGKEQSLADRLAWAKMRMDPADISDVTGAVLSYLVNGHGHGPADNWTGRFAPGERVRLRFVNAAAMTVFDVRIPGLTLSVVAADGQNVQPVAVEEFQISPGEIYDVMVTPVGDRAYTIAAEAVDRSGMARATLGPRAGMVAPVPALCERPLLTMNARCSDEGCGDEGHEHAQWRKCPPGKAWAECRDD
jgi:CopA family copper-resistance protein